MEKEYRGCGIAVLITAIFLGGVWILLGALLHRHIVLSGEMVAILGIAIPCVFFIPALCLFFLGVSDYNKKVVVRSDSVSYYHWGRQVRTFQKEEITVYGVAQFYAKDAYIFYCRASEDDILRYWNAHQKMAKRIFRKHYGSLKEGDEKLWQLMVGTYIRRKLSSRRDDVIVTDCTYHIGFDEIVKILNKKPILTGIVLLNDPGSWADEIKRAGV